MKWQTKGISLLSVLLLVTNGVAITSPADSVTTVDSTFDPQVEFLEVGVNVNGTFTSKVYGPDANGVYGGLQGVGGIETLYITGHTTAYGSVQDYFGNVLASMSNNVVTWSGARYSSYGPVPGYQPPMLSIGVAVPQSLGWHGWRMDPSGDYYTGTRPYDPVTARFDSPDPLGHSGSMDLYSYCGGNPNCVDPTGRFGKQIANDYQNIVDNLTEARDIADSQITYADSDFHYADEDQTAAAQWSSLVDMVPVVGGLKQWAEMNTGKDMFTGQYIQGNQYLQALGVVVNFAPVAFGPASLLEGGGEAAFFGAGEQGLIEEGEVEVAASEANIIRGVNFTETEEVAVEAEFNIADVQANGTYGGGAFRGASSSETVATLPAQSTAAGEGAGSEIPNNAAARVQGILDLYPQVIDPRTGVNIPFPGNVGSAVQPGARVSWGASERGAFINEWYQRGYATPAGGWENYDIHHILPREYGGNNDFWNLVPVERQTHQELFNSFWRDFFGL